MTEPQERPPTTLKVETVAELRYDLQQIALRLADLGLSPELMAVNEAYVRLGRRYPDADLPRLTV